jgi:hypothetical protein
MKKIDGWEIPLGMLACVAMVAVFLHYQPHKSEAVAAWVQAFGSIGAIAGAVWIGNRQVRAALSTEARASAGHRKSILAIAEAAYEHSERFRRLLVQQDPRVSLSLNYHESIINGVVEALGGVPFHEVGSRDGVMAVLSLRDQLVFLKTSIEIFLAGPWRHPDLGPELEQYKAAGETAIVRNLLEVGNNVLAKNVVTHLDVIRHNYLALTEAVRIVNAEVDH